MINRRDALKLTSGGAAVLAAPMSAWSATPPRVGFLVSDSFSTLISAFRSELTQLGYVEGGNLILEIRQSRPNSADLQRQAAELVGLQVDLIVAASLPSALEVRRLNPRMLMVVATAPGLVENGFARSLERPGGVVTGMDELTPGLTGKRLSLLKAAAPKVKRVALLSTTPGQISHELQLVDAQAAARQLEMTVRPYRVESLPELRPALESIAADGMEGLVNFTGVLSLVNRQAITDFAALHRLPAIYQSALFVETGGLMAYAPDQEEQFRIAARYVDQIIKGAKPGDLPIRHPERYLLTINRAVARRLDLSLPDQLTSQAYRIVD